MDCEGIFVRFAVSMSRRAKQGTVQVGLAICPEYTVTRPNQEEFVMFTGMNELGWSAQLSSGGGEAFGSVFTTT